MTAPCDTLTDLHWSILEQLDAGQTPIIPPLTRRKLCRMKLIVLTSPPRPPGIDGLKRRAPPPRQYALTERGRDRLAEHRRTIPEQTRHDIAASVARHADLDELIERSSIGQGLRRIREQGLDAELQHLDAELHPKGAR